MRVSNDRYTEEFRCFTLALRMLGHGARTSTVCLWTRLSTERVENLSLVHRREGHCKGPNHRGPSPRKLAAVLSSPSLRSEAAAVAGVCRFLKVIPKVPLANASSTLPNVERGEGLCCAYERFRLLIPNARLSLEEVALLVVKLAEGTEWSLEHCARCSDLMVVDRLDLKSQVCDDCQHEVRRSVAPASRAIIEAVDTPSAERIGTTGEQEQLDLFSDAVEMVDSGRKQTKEKVIDGEQCDAADRSREKRQPRHVQRRRRR